MRSWFLSYHSPDQALAERLKAAIERKDAVLWSLFRGSQFPDLIDEITRRD
jgi:hypothetical protein